MPGVVKVESYLGEAGTKVLFMLLPERSYHALSRVPVMVLKVKGEIPRQLANAVCCVGHSS